ncbi:MAG: ABC transporter ATP-binding protein, partial [Gammaproteobacteria bacterium]|nr:ABC transporter ATP-binding protein [Gammaproteobacteria bacterium]
MDKSIISFSKVSKRFGTVTAVDQASFDISQGEFFSLLGPSGCGKTTLLRIVAGFETPTEGEILIDGQPMSATPPNKRPVNMVFQNYAIFPHLDVRGNIAFGMRKSGLSKTDLNKRIDEVLELIKLPGYGSRGSDELSGGQRQRVALARALIKQPKVLLLDEPLGALDKKLREQMQIELRQLQQQLGITFLFVTHDQEEALTLSDRIAVMSDGEVIEIATPTELYESPSSRFVADFIGSMNFFEGEVVDCKARNTTIASELLGTVVASEVEQEFSGGTPVWIAIRP